jgi:hypothetical protein
MFCAIVSDAALSAIFSRAELPVRAFLHVAADSTAAHPVRCWIRTTLASEGVRLDAMGAADTTIAANYRFRVAKSSASGSSLNMQSGNSVLGQTPKILTTVALDRSAVDHYDATLSLNWDGGHVSCVAP